MPYLIEVREIGAFVPSLSHHINLSYHFSGCQLPCHHANLIHDRRIDSDAINRAAVRQNLEGSITARDRQAAQFCSKLNSTPMYSGDEGDVLLVKILLLWECA